MVRSVNLHNCLAWMQPDGAGVPFVSILTTMDGKMFLYAMALEET